jgi:hypothetical protein
MPLGSARSTTEILRSPPEAKSMLIRPDGQISNLHTDDNAPTLVSIVQHSLTELKPPLRASGCGFKPRPGHSQDTTAVPHPAPTSRDVPSALDWSM